MKTLMKILKGIVIFIVFVIVLALVLTQGIADTAKSQLKAIRNGDVAKAYSYTSKTFQQITSFEDFKKFIETYEPFKNNDDVSFSSRETKNDIGLLVGELKSKDGKKTAISYKLIKENGDWKIEAIKFDSNNEGVSTASSSVSPTITESQTAESKINDILINDTADSEGYVAVHKSSLKEKPAKIYATVQVLQAQAGTSVFAEMTYVSTGQKIGPLENKIDKSGNVLKAFSFTSTGGAWISGKYKIKATLSAGDSKEVEFSVL